MYPSYHKITNAIIKLSIVYQIVSECACNGSSAGIGNYGTDWLYFPDGDGVPRFVNLIHSESIPKVSSRMQSDVEFRLYNKKDSGNYLVLNDLLNDEEFISNNILPGVPLKVITHGWMSTADKNAVMDLVNAYLLTQEVNIIAVDWSSYSVNYVYPSAADKTKDAGRKVAQFLDLLHNRFNISGDQMHLIGHSLGAHVMGVAGFESKVKIGRITGLDPALPLFKGVQETKFRLDYNDATFVDIIHTCGGVLGFWDAIGTADFYPNYGLAPQPGCKGLNIFQFEACSHGRSINYFSESILNPRAFPAYECDGWRDNVEDNCPFAGYMGESANWDMSGIFHLDTNSEEPFGRGMLTST